MRPRRSLQHGEYGYARREKCRCDMCLRVMRQYQKRREYDQVRGVSRRADAAPVRRHVQRLFDVGITAHQISIATGKKVTPQQIKNLIGGSRTSGKPVAFLAPHTAQILLGVTKEMADVRFKRVPSVGVHRRLRALQWMGYTLPDLAERLGMGYTAIYHYMQREQVTVDTATKVASLYTELSMKVGPNDRERWRAYRNGWLPPMAWDEHTIDDPDAEPDLASLSCVVGHCLRPVFQKSLCRSHYYIVSAAGGVKESRKYRAAVKRLSLQPKWTERESA